MCKTVIVVTLELAGSGGPWEWRTGIGSVLTMQRGSYCRNPV